MIKKNDGVERLTKLDEIVTYNEYISSVEYKEYAEAMNRVSGKKPQAEPEKKKRRKRRKDKEKA